MSTTMSHNLLAIVGRHEEPLLCSPSTGDANESTFALMREAGFEPTNP